MQTPARFCAICGSTTEIRWDPPPVASSSTATAPIAVQAELDRCLAERDEARAECTALRKGSQELEERVQQLLANADNLRKRVTTVSEEAQRSDKLITARLEQEKARCEELQAQLSASDTTTLELRAELDKALLDAHGLSEQLSATQSASATDVAAAEANASALRRELAAAEALVLSSRAALDGRSEAAEQLQLASDTRISQLETELEEQKKNLTAQIQLMGDLYDKLAKEHTAENKAAEEARAAGARAGEEARAAQDAALEEAERRLAQADTLHEQTQQELEAALAQAAALAKQMAEAEAESRAKCDQLEAQCSSLATQLGSEQAASRALEAKVSGLSEELGGATHLLSALEDSKQASSAELEQSTAQVEGLMAGVAAIAAELEQCTESARNTREYMLSDVGTIHSRRLGAATTPFEKGCAEQINQEAFRMVQQQYDAFERIFRRFSVHVQASFEPFVRMDPEASKRAAGPLPYQSPHCISLAPSRTVAFQR